MLTTDILTKALAKSLTKALGLYLLQNKNITN